MSKIFTISDLYSFIKVNFNIQEITPILNKQINNFILEKDMTPLEIARCIEYYLKALKQEYKSIYGISFVLNIREEAARYYKQLELDQKKKTIEAKRVVEYQDNNIIFNISAIPHQKRKPKQIDISNISIEEVNND